MIDLPQSRHNYSLSLFLSLSPPPPLSLYFPHLSLSLLLSLPLDDIFYSLLLPLSISLSLPRCFLSLPLSLSTEGELRGGCSWRGPPCLVITSLFITHTNGPQGEGNNNKLIEYELPLNRNLQHFILGPSSALADEMVL